MNDSESESDREGEQFFYDDTDNNIIYPKRIRRRSKTSLHVMAINNAYYKVTQNTSALRTGFDTWKKVDREETLCDCCFHSVICSFIMIFIHKIVIENFYHFFR